MKKTLTAFAAAAAVASFTGAASAEVFSFSAISDGAGFNGAIDAPSDSGNYTLTSESATFLQENGSVIFMFQAGGPGGTISHTLNVLDAGDNIQDFDVNSIDWRAFTGTGDATLTGYSGGAGGTQEWQIVGPQDIDPPVTQLAPTTGSFGNTIDTIVWSIDNYVDNTFGNTIDNVDINIVPEPASFALAGLGGLLLASRRRAR